MKKIIMTAVLAVMAGGAYAAEFSDLQTFKASDLKGSEVNIQVPPQDLRDAVSDQKSDASGEGSFLEAKAPGSYKCKANDQEGLFGSLPQLVVEFNSEKVKVKSTDADGVTRTALGTLKEYASNHKKDYVRYVGLRGLIDESGEVTLLANKDLLSGASRGIVKLQWTGEAFESSEYTCVRNMY